MSQSLATFSHFCHLQPRKRAELMMDMHTSSPIAALWSAGFRVAIAPLNGRYVSGFRFHLADLSGSPLTWSRWCSVMESHGIEPDTQLVDLLLRFAEGVEARNWWALDLPCKIQVLQNKFNTEEGDLDLLTQLAALACYRPGSTHQIGYLSRGGIPTGPLAFLAAISKADRC